MENWRAFIQKMVENIPIIDARRGSDWLDNTPKRIENCKKMSTSSDRILRRNIVRFFDSFLQELLFSTFELLLEILVEFVLNSPIRCLCSCAEITIYPGSCCPGRPP